MLKVHELGLQIIEQTSEATHAMTQNSGDLVDVLCRGLAAKSELRKEDEGVY